MYQIDERDALVQLLDLPRPDVGVPLPAVVAAEHRVDLIYILSDSDLAWNGTSVRLAERASEGRRIAHIRFDEPCASALNTIRLPSGDHTGELLLPSNVSLAGADRSTS